MSLGDIYGKVTKSGNDKGVNAVTRSSEDGSEFIKGPAKDKKTVDLERKQAEVKSIEAQMIALDRDIVHADLHKTDYESYKLKKMEIQAKIKHLDECKRRLSDEIRRLERDIGLIGRHRL